MVNMTQRAGLQSQERMYLNANSNCRRLGKAEILRLRDGQVGVHYELCGMACG
jgi:hypothetical protein